VQLTREQSILARRSDASQKCLTPLLQAFGSSTA
jgi:hypothetical protein